MRRFREQNGITTTDLGSMLGVSQSSVSAYEQAKTRIPDDVFETLVEVARDKLEFDTEAAQAAQAAQDAGPAPEIPPEVLEALRLAERASAGDKEAASKMGEAMRDLQQGMVAGMSDTAKAAVTDVQLAYQLLAKILGRLVDPQLGELIDRQSGELAVSVVQASEVSPLLARIVALLKVGPISSCIALHVMLLVEYDGIRQARRAALRAEMAARAGQRTEPMPAQAAETLDSSLGAFAA